MESKDLIHLPTALPYGARWMGGCVGPSPVLTFQGREKCLARVENHPRLFGSSGCSIVTMPAELPQLYSVINEWHQTIRSPTPVISASGLPYRVACVYGRTTQYNHIIGCKEIVFQTASMFTIQERLLSPCSTSDQLYQARITNKFISCRVCFCQLRADKIWSSTMLVLTSSNTTNAIYQSE